jgi:ribosomal protein S12 methylthiotransferase accessory factor YcaO
VAEINEPITDIWWCRINLTYNNILLASSNGKGTSKEYALASGYSELYERYCCLFNPVTNSKINNDKLYSICKEERGYLYSDEVYLTPKEAINSIP